MTNTFTSEDNYKIPEYEVHQYGSHISINNININKVIVSSKLRFDKQNFKYLIVYKNDRN